MSQSKLDLKLQKERNAHYASGLDFLNAAETTHGPEQAMKLAAISQAKFMAAAYLTQVQAFEHYVRELS